MENEIRAYFFAYCVVCIILGIGFLFKYHEAAQIFSIIGGILICVFIMFKLIRD